MTMVSKLFAQLTDEKAADLRLRLGALPHPSERAATVVGRPVAVATMNASSSVLIRRGRPPAQLGSSARSPIPLKAWITSRTLSSCAATNRRQTFVSPH
jgi:hypothetical protein